MLFSLTHVLAIFYVAARRLLSRLDADFSLNYYPAPGPRLRSGHKNVYGVERPVHTFMFPDAVMVAAILVCAKLVWGMDGKIR